MIPKVTSLDMPRVRQLHRRLPGLINKTFPAAIRKEILPFKRSLRNKMRIQNWSRSFEFSKGAKSIDTHKVKTKKIKGRGKIGIDLTPANQGVASIYEHGTKGRSRRSGGSTGRVSARPAFESSWRGFKTLAKTTVRENLIRITDREAKKMMTRVGLKWL